MDQAVAEDMSPVMNHSLAHDGSTADDGFTDEIAVTPVEVAFPEPIPLAHPGKGKDFWRLPKMMKRAEREPRKTDEHFELDSIHEKEKDFWRFPKLTKRTEQETRKRDEQFELDSLSFDDIESTDPIFDTSDDDFQKDVVYKTQKYLIGKREAEVRVLLDRVVENKGGDDQALLFILSQDNLPTRKVEIFANVLLHRGANPSVCDKDLQTPLHHAARRNLFEVCRRLVENDALPNVTTRKKVRPLTWAVRNGNDQIGALLLDCMTNADVRSVFVSSGETRAEFSCKDLLAKNMEETVMSLLNCMIDQVGSSNRVKVYYNLLESDSFGRTPTNPLFEKNAKSVLYHIAKRGNKTIIYHEVVRLLLMKKWKEDMRLRFMLSASFYIFTLFALTYSAVVAVMTTEPTIYDSPLQISRAVFEVLACLFITITFLMELNQFKRHKLQYWRDLFNILDIVSSTLIIIVVPLRFTYMQAQWHVFSIGYILWTFRIFKYSAVFRQTGAYAHILWRVLSYDIVQFMMFFLLILLAFSGSYLLALRGDNSLSIHSETSTFWGILFNGFRTLIDTEPLVENYVELPPLSVILVVVFMFMSIVVMLNLLIAQLSDTYQNIQSDAQRGLELNRAWIVTRMEINSLFMWRHRLTKYKEFEEFQDFKEVLEKWDSPPLDGIHTKLRRIEAVLDATQVNQTTVLQRLAWQEKALLDIQNRLQCLVSGIKSHDGTGTDL